MRKKLLNTDPRDIEILRSFVLQKTRAHLLAHPEIKMNFLQSIYFAYLRFQRNRGMPLAYLVGHKEFFGLDFIVNKYTLIPRPDTEIMVESVLDTVKKIDGPCTLIDVGTGTGCIPISIAHNTSKITHIYAVDISKKALKVAQQNCKKHRIKIETLSGNLLTPLVHKLQGHLIITANLPYLTKQEFVDEPSIHFEPKIALIVDANGLGAYQNLLKQICELNYNDPIDIFLEINPHQKNEISKISKELFPNADSIIKTDLADRDRLVQIRLNTFAI
jgi:release factor glutamine methyltransferase